MNTATKSSSLCANFRFASLCFVLAAGLSFPIANARAANPEATETPDPVEEKGMRREPCITSLLLARRLMS
jgi:hypothetical protein